MEANAKGQIEKLTIEAVVIRADGRREELGVVSEYVRPKGLAAIGDKLRNAIGK